MTTDSTHSPTANCPKCQRENFSERELCLYCGCTLQSAPVGISAESDTIDCSKCGKSNPNSRLNCLHCATFLPHPDRGEKILEHVSRTASVMGEAVSLQHQRIEKGARFDMLLFFLAAPLIAFNYLRFFMPGVRVKRWGYLDPIGLAIGTVLGGFLVVGSSLGTRSAVAAPWCFVVGYFASSIALWTLFFRRHKSAQSGFILGYSFAVVAPFSWGMLALVIGLYGVSIGYGRIDGVGGTEIVSRVQEISPLLRGKTAGYGSFWVGQVSLDWDDAIFQVGEGSQREFQTEEPENLTGAYRLMPVAYSEGEFWFAEPVTPHGRRREDFRDIVLIAERVAAEDAPQLAERAEEAGDAPESFVLLYNVSPAEFRAARGIERQGSIGEAFAAAPTFTRYLLPIGALLLGAGIFVMYQETRDYRFGNDAL